ncbi:hypothetical protein [Clostridium luticellarii]|uniref:Uncharacterized protein n=1 Tax=Clostridium luticellarii TaxID=1691940 RepID=A0A2T0BNV5_9CLOT|nr:hypothetical protein [Clostridium luticellarii]PRR85553.1 hypothetical protein CLLU_14740 [Clostridium luticellarii]
MSKEIRLLNADEIEVRVQSVKSNGCILLLYKDARVDMRILDETYGPTGWQREHQLINNNLFCTISIWDDEKKQWIKKQDVGVESYTEKEKGQASDSFKRAGFNVGIGRELYTAPFIWVNLQAGEVKDKGDKSYINPHLHFRVKSIAYNDKREIEKLDIVDNNNVVRFSMGKSVTPNYSEKYKQNIQNKESNNSSNGLTCEKCGKKISEKVAEFSTSKFKKKLCMDCQKTFTRR